MPIPSKAIDLDATPIPHTEDDLANFDEAEHAYGLETARKRHRNEAKRGSWRTILRVGLGISAGIGLLVLITRVVDISVTLEVLRWHLASWQGLCYASGAGLAFIAAFSVRALRWRVFLRRVGHVRVSEALQIYWIGVFVNFLLPIQGGELSKSLLLKRVTGIAVSRSLPTVAMDKALDLLPALVIMALVPFLPGIHMGAALWGVLGFVCSLLIGLVGITLITAWKREFALVCIQKVTVILPKALRERANGFALGFVDALLAIIRCPRDFVPALLLTGLAVICEGVFALLSFWTVGLYLSPAMALFGYTAYNMFFILPNPPGQVGSNELAGILVFTGLLGFPRANVLAMFVFSHTLAALIMVSLGLLGLGRLGVTFSQALQREDGRA